MIIICLVFMEQMGCQVSIKFLRLKMIVFLCYIFQEILENYSLTASRLRQELSRIIELAKESDYCKCSKPSFDGCIHCLRRGVVTLLCEKGFRASLCTSRWRHTKKFPGGKTLFPLKNMNHPWFKLCSICTTLLDILVEHHARHLFPLP